MSDQISVKEYKDPFKRVVSNKNASESGVSCQTEALKR